MTLKILFWLFLCIIVYTYVGYTLILFLGAVFKAVFGKATNKPAISHEPDVTLVIPSYNEEQFVVDKVRNSMDLDYPPEKLKIVWITDGTTDNTDKLLEGYSGVVVMHENDRLGKIHAMNRAMKVVNTPVVVFSDANSMLNREAIREIVKPFADIRTGCVTGEKRIADTGMQKAVGAGEGLYWKYESLIKRLESETGSVVGAVGEIFAIRTSLYEEVSEDTLLDDFTLSLQMIRKGYRIKYAPYAWGTETASLSVSEEIKRKIRIASGGMQSLTRMTDLLNPFKYGLISFKYLSHKVFRWTLVPISFPLIFVLNLVLLYSASADHLYTVIFGLQCLFYILALAGRIMENVKTRLSALFAPYYLFIMNYAVLLGFIRFLKGDYSVKWQKVKRT